MKLFPKHTNSRLYKTIFGYDIFISYSRRDSLDYAYAISTYFISRGYECYIDQLSSVSPGKELPASIKNAVKNSTSFILIGSEGSKMSEPIQSEIKLFLEHNKNRPIIPITIDGCIDNSACWFETIDGLAMIDDTSENLEKGIPSDQIFARIENALKFTKKSRRLRNFSILVFFAVLVVTIVAIGYSVLSVNKAVEKTEEANRVAMEETLKAEEARAATLEALKVMDSVNVLKNQLNDKVAFLDVEVKNKNKKIEQVNSLYTRQFKSAEEMTKEFSYAIDNIPGFASYCPTETLEIEKGQLVLFTKLDRFVIEKKHIKILDKFLTDWKQSVNKPKIIVEGHYVAYRIDEESLEIIQMTSKGDSAYNLKISEDMASLFSKYLTKNGIPVDSIAMRGYGDTQKNSNGILFNSRIEIYTK